MKALDAWSAPQGEQFEKLLIAVSKRSMIVPSKTKKKKLKKNLDIGMS